MPGTTTNFQLPYPTSTDQPCAGPAQIEALAEKIDSSLTLVEANIPRLSIIPFARMSSQAGYTLSGLAVTPDALVPFQFDSIDVDTDNMANLSTSIFGITPQRTGIFEAGFYVHLGASFATSANNGLFQVNMSINPDIETSAFWHNGDSGPSCQVWDGGLGNTDSYLTIVAELPITLPVPTTPGPAFIVTLIKQGTFASGHADTQSVLFSIAWLRWLRDLP